MAPTLLIDEDAMFSPLSPFQPLGGQIEPHEALDEQTLNEGFTRVLRSTEAKTRCNVVFIWAVTKPYQHSNEKGRPSRIIYIEKTDGSIFRRWPPRYINLLAGGADDEVSEVTHDLRNLAILARNGQFYRTVISAFGPLRVWWSDVGRLNAKWGRELRTPREWERLILKGYRELNDCLPLKNLKC